MSSEYFKMVLVKIPLSASYADFCDLIYQLPLFTVYYFYTSVPHHRYILYSGTENQPCLYQLIDTLRNVEGITNFRYTQCVMDSMNIIA